MSDAISAISLVVGVAGLLFGIWSWIHNQNMDRDARQSAHTADFLSQLLTNEILAEANYTVGKLIDKEVKIQETDLNEETEKKLVALLNHYEYICAFFYRNVLHHGLVHDLRSGPMCRAFDVSSDVIKGWQKRRPRVYEFLEKFYREFGKEHS